MLERRSGREPETIKLSVEPNTVISPSIGADYTLSLTAPEAWTASCADSWVKVSPHLRQRR
ncbi:MAG: BACON domain-containing protein [Paludibacteraceae bacterium]|nr:BACON domain-containing protein [Paludibacteraceae bacterium]